MSWGGGASPGDDKHAVCPPVVIAFGGCVLRIIKVVQELDQIVVHVNLTMDNQLIVIDGVPYLTHKLVVHQHQKAMARVKSDGCLCLWRGDYCKLQLILEVSERKSELFSF